MKMTQFVRKEDAKGNWYVLDAKEAPVGRIATMAALLLRGKHRPDFTPHIDMGDHVVIMNASDVILTGDKWVQKKYYRHSGYPGGLTETSAKKMMNTHPERILLYAIRGMLPKNRLGRKLLKKLRIYTGSEHVHGAQNPTPIKLSEKKFIEVTN